MPFVNDQEAIILMDIPNRDNQRLTIRELRQLRSAGIETAMYFSLFWDSYEPKPGDFNLDYFVEIIGRFELVGMKVILPLWNMQSSHLPDAWYAKGPHGGLNKRGLDKEYIISPWSEAGQAYANKIMAQVKREYANDQVMIMASGVRDGESIMPSEPLYFGVDALANWKSSHRGLPDHQTKEAIAWLKDGYTRMIVERQKVLGAEVWAAWHFRKAASNCLWGCQWVDDYMAALTQLPLTQANHISFSHFPYDDMPARIEAFRSRWHTNEWVGAEYCEGLRGGNAKKARDASLRGLILAPCHPYTGHLHLDPWMLAEIEKAVRLFERVNV